MLNEQVQGVDTTPADKTEHERKLEARARRIANLKPAQKGEVRNPRGRPKKDFVLADLAVQHAEKAIATLVDVMSNTDNPPASRISAAAEILDRGFGRAPASLDVKHEIGFGEQFEDFIRGLMGSRHAAVIEHQVVDAAE